MRPHHGVWEIMGGTATCVALVITFSMLTIAFAPAVGGSDQGDPEYSPWSTFGGNPQHDGLSRYASGATDYQVLWNYQAPEGVTFTSSLIGSDGTLLAHGSDGILYAIAPNGTLIWTFGGGDLWSYSGVGPDGRIYAGSYVLDRNGTTVDAYGSNPNPLVMDRGSNAYFMRVVANSSSIYSDYYLSCLAPNGTLAWSYLMGDMPSLAAIGHDGRIFTGAGKYLYAVDPNGTLSWKVEIGNGDYICSVPSIGPDGTIYFSTSRGMERPGHLCAFDPNGTVKWKYQMWGFGYFTAPAIAADGTIYFVLSEVTNYAQSANGTDVEIQVAPSRIVAMSPDGLVRCQKEMELTGYEFPAISADGRLFIGSGDTFYVLDQDLNVVWSHRTVGTAGWCPAIGLDGTVYFSGEGTATVTGLPVGYITAIRGGEASTTSPQSVDGDLVFLSLTGLTAMVAVGAVAWFFVMKRRD